MLVKERCSSEAVGIFVRCGSLWLSFMALLGTVDSKTRLVSHNEVHDKTPPMVVNLARSDTQEDALKDGFWDQWTPKSYSSSELFYMRA